MIPEVLYCEIHQVMPIPCVDLIIIRGEQALLGKRSNKPVLGQWWFPGGRVKKGETLDQAAIRQGKRELGLSLVVSDIEQIGVDTTIFEDDGPYGWTTHTINVVYLVNIDEEIEVVPDDQHSEFKWIEVDNQSLNKYLAKWINKVVENKIIHAK